MRQMDRSKFSKVHIARLIATFVLVFCAGISRLTLAQVVATAPAAPTAPTLGGSVGDRTRPFAVGEKRAYFTNIQDGDRVFSPFRVAFAVSGMGVAPVKAGLLEGTGHHHILIDLPLPADIKKPIPFDAPNEFVHQHYKHFGGGETETVLTLPPGKHTLRLLFADANHVPYYIDSSAITITVLPTVQQ